MAGRVQTRTHPHTPKNKKSTFESAINYGAVYPIEQVVSPIQDEAFAVKLAHVRHLDCVLNTESTLGVHLGNMGQMENENALV